MGHLLVPCLRGSSGIANCCPMILTRFLAKADACKLHTGSETPVICGYGLQGSEESPFPRGPPNHGSQARGGEQSTHLGQIE